MIRQGIELRGFPAYSGTLESGQNRLRYFRTGLQPEVCGIRMQRGSGEERDVQMHIRLKGNFRG